VAKTTSDSTGPNSANSTDDVRCQSIPWESLRLAYLLLPLLGAALGVGLCNRYDWARCLAVAVDGGLTLRGRRLFGNNKTVRGVLAGALGTAVVMTLQAEVGHRLGPVRVLEYVDYSAIRPWRFGFLLGLARMLSELPNSFVKRQLDIQPGQLGGGAWLPVCYLLDRFDYLPATWLVCSRLVRLTPRRAVISIVLVFIADHLANFVGYHTGMRRSLH